MPFKKAVPQTVAGVLRPVMIPIPAAAAPLGFRPIPRECAKDKPPHGLFPFRRIICGGKIMQKIFRQSLPPESFCAEDEVAEHVAPREGELNFLGQRGLAMRKCNRRHSTNQVAMN